MFAARTYGLKVSKKPPNSNIWHPNRPYNQLPPLPPKTDLETKAILKGCINARAALAELKAQAEHLPNPGMLINTLPLLEAQASSEIENIVTTADRLFQFQAALDHADPATKEALRYSSALLEGYGSLATLPLSTRTAETICSKIKDAQVQIRHGEDTRVVHARTGQAIYTPPSGERLLRDLLANWERFLHEATYLDPLIRLAVGHYQFEAIHPFTDGNGRTGRVINSLFLIEEKLLKLPILYLSHYLIKHRADYYRLLLGVTREASWEEWILYMIRGIQETSLWTIGKIEGIRSLLTQTAEHIRHSVPKLYSHELAELIFAMPYCRIGNLTQAGLGTRQTASVYLKALVSIGVLEQKTVGREKLFVHPKLMQLLTRDRNSFSPYRDEPR